MQLRLQSACIAGYLLMGLTGACGPKQRVEERSTVKSGSADAVDKEPGRRASYSGKDIESIEILPKKPAFQPWVLNRLILVGTFPDGMQGNITENVKWSINAKAPDAIIDAETGEIAAAKAISLVVKVDFRGMKTERDVELKYPADSYIVDLPDPVNLVAEKTGAGTIKLKWLAGPDFISGYRLVFRKGSTAAPEKCEAAENVELVNEDILKPRSNTHELTNLDSGSVYHLRMCAVQTLSVGKQKIERLSAGVVLKVETNSEPGDN